MKGTYRQQYADTSPCQRSTRTAAARCIGRIFVNVAHDAQDGLHQVLDQRLGAHEFQLPRIPANLGHFILENNLHSLPDTQRWRQFNTSSSQGLVVQRSLILGDELCAVPS